MSAVPAPKSVQMQQQHVPSYLQQQQHYHQQQQVPSYGSSVVPPPPPPQVPSYGQQQQPIVVDPQMMYNNNNNQGVYHQHQGQGQQGYYNSNNYNNHHQGRQNQQQQYSNNKNNTNHNNNNNNIPKENTTGNATNCDPTTHTEVYAFNNVALYTIPHEDILSMPALDDPSNSQIKNLQLCPNFDPKNPATSCDKGAACKFVHAKLDNAETHNIHVNYAWTNPEDVLYETFPAGEMLAVAPPNSNTATDEIPSHLVLKTRALQSNRRVISHCAHYYFNRVCNRGSECYFIHAVSLTPVINEAGYIEDRSRRIWGRTQTKKNPPTNQNSQRQTPTPTPQVSKLGSNLGAIASASGFQTPSYNTLSRQDSTVGRTAGFPTYPPQQNQNGGMALPSLSQMHAAFLNGGSTQDLTKLNTQSDNSDSDGVDGDLDKSANNNKNQNNNNNSGNGSKQGSKNNSALSSPFRRTHNPYSMTNPVVRSYNGSPVSPVPVHVGSQA